MTFIRKNAGNLIMLLCELAVGVLLLINPESFMQGIMVALGVALAVAGVLSVARYFRTDAVNAAAERRLALGLGEIALGVFCVAKGGWLVTLSTLIRLYGAGVLALGFFRVQQFADVRRLGLGTGIVSGVSALVTLVYAGFILALPEVTWLVIGIALLLEAVMDALMLIFERSAQ